MNREDEEHNRIKEKLFSILRKKSNMINTTFLTSSPQRGRGRSKHSLSYETPEQEVWYKSMFQKIKNVKFIYKAAILILILTVIFVSRYPSFLKQFSEKRNKIQIIGEHLSQKSQKQFWKDKDVEVESVKEIKDIFEVPIESARILYKQMKPNLEELSNIITSNVDAGKNVVESVSGVLSSSFGTAFQFTTKHFMNKFNSLYNKRYSKAIVLYKPTISSTSSRGLESNKLLESYFKSSITILISSVAFLLQKNKFLNHI